MLSPSPFAVICLKLLLFHFFSPEPVSAPIFLSHFIASSCLCPLWFYCLHAENTFRFLRAKRWNVNLIWFLNYFYDTGCPLLFCIILARALQKPEMKSVVVFSVECTFYYICFGGPKPLTPQRLGFSDFSPPAQCLPVLAECRKRYSGWMRPICPSRN